MWLADWLSCDFTPSCHQKKMISTAWNSACERILFITATFTPTKWCLGIESIASTHWVSEKFGQKIRNRRHYKLARFPFRTAVWVTLSENDRQIQTELISITTCYRFDTVLFVVVQIKNMSRKQSRIFLWAVPRSISTAFFRAMMNKSNCKVSALRSIAS